MSTQFYIPEAQQCFDEYRVVERPSPVSCPKCGYHKFYAIKSFKSNRSGVTRYTEYRCKACDARNRKGKQTTKLQKQAQALATIKSRGVERGKEWSDQARRLNV